MKLIRNLFESSKLGVSWKNSSPNICSDKFAAVKSCLKSVQFAHAEEVNRRPEAWALCNCTTATEARGSPQGLHLLIARRNSLIELKHRDAIPVFPLGVSLLIRALPACLIDSVMTICRDPEMHFAHVFMRPFTQWAEVFCQLLNPTSLRNARTVGSGPSRFTHVPRFPWKGALSMPEVWRSVSARSSGTQGIR
ncbi:hypothetical protein BDV11DRAFT_188429 [Aspergillus similis]